MSAVPEETVDSRPYPGSGSSGGAGGGVTAFVGTGAVTDVVVTLGAGHPSTHGALRLALRLDGDRIVSADPQVGYLHRGAEKLFEVRDYRQIGMLANRHDWLSSFGSELGVALVVERMLGLHVPPRARWLRTLLAELTRVLHHLAFLGTYPLDVSARAARGEQAHRREQARAVIQRRLEEATGGRMHEMYVRVGGLHRDVPDGWPQAVAETVAEVRPEVHTLRELVETDPGVLRATRGVGILNSRDAAAYGASGPTARASGLDMDLRRDHPYDAYGELDVRVVTRQQGDSQARLSCLAEECEVSLDLVERCLQSLPEGPVTTRLPKVLRIPEGHGYLATENPAGMNGWFLVSRGEPTPHRLKLRTASFPHAALLSVLLPGLRVADIPAVLASLSIIVGDIDR